MARTVAVAIWHCSGGDHGPGKRWEGTSYTCTDCRRPTALAAALADIGRWAASTEVAMQNVTAALDGVIAAFPEPAP